MSALGSATHIAAARNRAVKYRLTPSTRAVEAARRLSLRDALAQVCCPLYFAEADATLGGAHIPRGPFEQVRARTAALRSVCQVPPLCTADLECGVGRGVPGLTVFPDLMGLGANDSEDLAYAVVYLASDESRYVTGTEFRVDAGYPNV